jgi:hypothetical protein
VRGLLLVAVTAVALVWATQASPRPPCTPGVRTAGGVTSRTFCGSAGATLRLGGKTYRYAGGECQRTGKSFAVNIGTITLPPGKPKHRYFGIAVFTGKDGTYREQAVALQFPGGKRLSLFHAKIVLEGGRTRGTFAGKTLSGRIPGSGTFHC